MLSCVAVVLLGVVSWTIWSFVGGHNSSAASSTNEGDAAAGGKYLQASMPNLTPEAMAAEKSRRDAADKRVVRDGLLSKKIIPYLTTYCSDCHDAESQEAGIIVTDLKSLDQLLNERKMWERVYRMINAGAMPPSGHEPRPAIEQQQQVAEFFYDELYNFDCALVYNPGRSTVQRLNRAEYNNTIRDLFGIDITPADDFPADDVGEGFDNIGDVLSLPPLLMEKYLNAAELVASAVIDTTDYSKPRTVTLDADHLKSSNGAHAADGAILLSSNGTITGEFNVAATGEYEIRVRAMAHQMDKERARFSLSVGDTKLKEFEVQEDRKNEDFTYRCEIKAGKTKIVTAFLNDAYDAKRNKDRNFGVVQLQVYGPSGGVTPEYHETHRRFVTVTPKETGDPQQAAHQVLLPIMERAFRRKVSDGEIQRYASLANRAVNDMGESYEGGLSLALQAILVAPDFLFRLEREPSPGQPERVLDDFEVATRLSYFLWSSMPDTELFELAKTGQLLTPETLRQQIQRMLKDEKASALVQNFAAQWLNLRNLDSASPDPDKFKTFDDNLRRDMRTETELLFKAVMQEDRSVEELLSADFTFLNERLAEHYGISGVNTDEFERVSLAGTNRSGVLTHASILTLTSEPGRTSPVKRGKWILENIFNEAPPPPPPNVPELEATANASPDASLREQLEKHRADPGCAACHKVMDPLGFGFENFDAVGQWRDNVDGKPIDASGTLPTGESFTGSQQLIRVIQNRREKFFRTVAEKMLVYAVGRGTEYYDKCAVDECLDLMKQNNNRFSSLVEGIVLSDPFLKRKGIDEAVASQ